MQKRVLSLLWLFVCLTVFGTNLSARSACCSGQSASINAVAIVVEPVGLIAVPISALSATAEVDTGSPRLALRLPLSGGAVIQFSAANGAGATLSIPARPEKVQKLEPDLLRRYQGGTITVIFTEN